MYMLVTWQVSPLFRLTERRLSANMTFLYDSSLAPLLLFYFVPKYIQESSPSQPTYLRLLFLINSEILLLLGCSTFLGEMSLASNT